MRTTIKSLGCLYLLGLVGCGPASADLSGRVTYQGKPVVSGSVTVETGSGLPVTGTIQPDGSYTVTGAAAGAVRVAVASPDPSIGPPIFAATKSKAKSLPPRVRPAGWVPLPDQYRDVRKSGFEFTLTPGSNVIDLDLK